MLIPHLRRLVVPFLASLLGFVASAGLVYGGDVTDTWKKRTEVQAVGATVPTPVVVFLHGCSGAFARPELTADTNAWAQTVTGAGWRFVVPDSWARGWWSRPDGCHLASVSSALKLRQMRREEAVYAVTQLQADPTVGADRIVLFGNSEGAAMLANVEPPAGVRAIIYAGWTCHASVDAFTGLTKSLLPLLVLEFERDSFLSNQGRCAPFFGDRPSAQELILPGEGHIAGGSEAARQAVVEFLKGLPAGPLSTQ